MEALWPCRRLGRQRARSPCACGQADQHPEGAEHRRADDRPGAPPCALAGRMGGKEPAVADAAQAPWSLFQPRLYLRLPMLAVPRRDADRSLLAGQPGDSHVFVAGPSSHRSAGEYRLAAQGQGGLRRGVEGQVAPELRLERRHWQRRRGLGPARHRGDGDELGLVGLESSRRRQRDPRVGVQPVRQVRRLANAWGRLS